MNLKFRFTLAISAGLLTLAAAFSALVYTQVEGRLFSDAKAALTATLEHEWQYIDLEGHQPDATSNHFDNVFFKLTADGKVIFSTFPERMNDAFDDSAHFLRQAQSQTRDGKLYELLGILNLGPTQRYLATLRRALWLGCALVFILALPLSYGCASLLLRPFKKLSVMASELTAERLSSLIPEPQYKDEYAKLVRSFNSLLLRLDRSFSLMRRFAVNASHEFRTPIAIITAQTEMALRRQREPAEYIQIIRKIDTQAKSLREITHMLLSLSELEKLEQEGTRSLDVRASLEAIIQSLTSKSETHKKAVALNIENFIYRGNEGIFQGVASNLIENALKYSKTAVKVSAANSLGALELKIEDDGDGIPEASFKRIGEPFFRVKPSDSDHGYGLGLALVSAYAKVNRTTLQFERSPMGGLSVSAKFPQASSA